MNSAAPTGAYSGTRHQDAATFRKEIRSYDPKCLFFDKIWDACDFKKVALRPAIDFVDGMCGPGRLGLDIKERVRQTFTDNFLRFAFYFNDVAHEPLMKLPNELTAPGDVRELGKKFPVKFHVAAVRYGIKDLPKEEQLNALVSLRDSLVPGGRIVIADMTAYNVGQQEAIIKVHSMKQKLAGRDEKAEGRCYIPTVMEWELLVADAGFKNIGITHHDLSHVSTSQWAGQFGGNDEVKIRVMNMTIGDQAASNDAFLKGCRVIFSQTLEATLDFPIMVLSADKPY